jgi:hypothetical protein
MLTPQPSDFVFAQQVEIFADAATEVSLAIAGSPISTCVAIVSGTESIGQ